MSLSAQEVFTILCLPAMAQEHVLTAPLAEGNPAMFTVCLAVTVTTRNSCHHPTHHAQLHLASAHAGTSFRAAVQHLAKTLKRVEVFYNSLGGLLGYQHKCLDIMLERQQQAQREVADGSSAAADVTFHMPQGPNLAGPNGRQLAAESAAAGLEALPHMAEIYPLGGQPANSPMLTPLSCITCSI